MGTLKLHSDGPLYSSTVTGTLAVDVWAVTFCYSNEGPKRGRIPPRPLLAVTNVTTHPSSANVLITDLVAIEIMSESCGVAKRYVTTKPASKSFTNQYCSTRESRMTVAGTRLAVTTMSATRLHSTSQNSTQTFSERFDSKQFRGSAK